MGILYLIQPAELLKTNRYKIGCSKKSTLDRVKNGYKKGTRYLLILECNQPFLIEKKIKEYFCEKYKLIAGNEYFEIDNNNEKELIEIFFSIVNKNMEYTNNISNYCNDKMNDEKNILYQKEDYDLKLWNIKINEDNIDNDYNNKYKINSYDEWSKLNNISNIIVFNKNHDSYIKFNDNNFWIETDSYETLDNYIYNYQNDDIQIIEINSNKIVRCKDYISTKDKSKFKFVNIEYDIKSIYHDIINLCYIDKKDIEYYNLEYHEYPLNIKCCISNKYYNVILDSKNDKLININNILSSKVLCHHDPLGRSILYKENMNTDIVEKILKALIIDEKKIIEFKNLAYSLIIKKRNKCNIIFYDNEEQYLTEWIRWIMILISGYKHYIYSNEDEKIYSDDIENNKIRCVIINTKNEYD